MPDLTEEILSDGVKNSPDDDPWRGCWFLFLAFALCVAIAIILPKPADNCGRNRADAKRLLEDIDAWNSWRSQYPERGYDLKNSDFRACSLDGALLQNSSLFKSCLTGVSLVGANLENTNISQAFLEDANLSSAKLMDASFIGSILTGVNLSNVDARGARFRTSDLRNADLSESDLTNAEFWGADLSGARLNGADLSGADLTFASLENVGGWDAIKSIKCANIFGMNAQYDFRMWALAHGALEIGEDEVVNWRELRDQCMGSDEN